MAIQFIPAYLKHKRNTLEVRICFEHGDDDAKTYEVLDVEIPKDKENLIEKIVLLIVKGIEQLNNQYEKSIFPYLIENSDMDKNNFYSENKLPLKGSEWWFVKEGESESGSVYAKGLIVSADENKVVLNSEGVNYTIKNTSRYIAPVTALPFMEAGSNVVDFDLEGIKVRIEPIIDCTFNDNTMAPAKVDEIFWYDGSAEKFIVSGF